MNFYIIRIKDNEHSVKAAERCYKSLTSFYGDKIPECYFDAITPKDNPIKILEEDGITNYDGFAEKYSRWENCIAAFTSHYSIWKTIVEKNKSAFIFEHDAVLVNSLPMTLIGNEFIPHQSLGDIVNVGQPSYGRFYTPENIGINSLISKRYFPGAHAYYLSPKGASILIEGAKKNPGPTDVFINYNKFNNLQEWYPWSAVARDSFSTIQNENGCQAKHGYNPERYKLVQVR